MSKNRKVICILGILIIVAISFVIGLFVGQANAPKKDLAIRKVVSQTFYATIESIKQYNDGSMHVNVKGLEVNDINYRGNYTFTINDNMEMTWRGENINLSDLKVGSNISITFTDEMILAISPSPLREVIKVQLLDDEK